MGETKPVRASTAAGTAQRKAVGPAKSAAPGKTAPAKTRPNAKTKARPRPKAKKRAPRLNLNPQQITAIFDTFAHITPEPKGELEHVNLYTLLVAVVLSAQATDAGVNRATRALFQVADTPQKMVALGEDKVRDYVKTIGLFRTKAKNVIALSQRLIADHAGTVPRDRDYLETLPGVGRKTANVVMNVWFGEPTMAVDTHVLRVSNRIGMVKSSNPLDTETQLLRVIPPQYGVPAHHWLILHGRYLCKARTPECWRCPIATLCQFADKSLAPKSRTK